jgi:hypothetical protein
MTATLLAIILAFTSSSSSASAAWSPSDPFQIAYTRYPAYPPYCSIPAEMAKRDIPPVADDDRLGESRLVHVTAVFRHGARTPYRGGNQHCWKGYLESNDTGVWDCDLKTITSPPTPKVVSEEEGRGNQGGDAMFLFEKRYDALQDSKDNLANSLNGTCQVRYMLYVMLCYIYYFVLYYIYYFVVLFWFGLLCMRQRNTGSLPFTIYHLLYCTVLYRTVCSWANLYCEATTRRLSTVST